MKSRVCVVGASGRMGQRVIQALREHPNLVLGSALDKQAQNAVTNLADDALSVADVVIDFAAPAAVAQVAPRCVARGIPYVLASTALTAEDEKTLVEAATRIPILQAANFSLGVNVMLELVEVAAKRLGIPFDIEISEIHHRHKRDAPSGTALSLGEAVKRGRGEMREVQHTGPTQGRSSNELGYAVMRGGDVAGEHTVYYLGDGERLEITHRSTTADIFARGAVSAAAWLVGRAPGRYTMRDVLFG